MRSLWQSLSGAVTVCGHWLRGLPALRAAWPWTHRCPRCGIRLHYGRKQMGRLTVCPWCGQTFTLPFVCED